MSNLAAPPPSLSLSLIADVELSHFIPHLTEADSHIDLGNDGQVAVLDEGSVEGNVNRPGSKPVYHPGNNAAMNDLEGLRAQSFC